VGLQVQARRVGTVADVILQFEADYYPESRSKLAFDYWVWLLRHSIRTLDLILTVSEFSKRAILELCDRYRMTCPPIIVTYEGVEISTSIEQLPQTKENYVVHLASKLPFKAPTWLLKQWLSLSESKKDLPELRLVGDLDVQGAATLSKIARARLVPPLPRPQLEELIAKARALLLPSEIEGFGIRSVEGYLLRTPVAYARETALEEILGSDSPGGFYRDRDSFMLP
jgi:glycosyltransferase involved in cell wall biosynthesis